MDYRIIVFIDYLVLYCYLVGEESMVKRWNVMVEIIEVIRSRIKIRI